MGIIAIKAGIYQADLKISRKAGIYQADLKISRKAGICRISDHMMLYLTFKGCRSSNTVPKSCVLF